MKKEIEGTDPHYTGRKKEQGRRDNDGQDRYKVVIDKVVIETMFILKSNRNRT